jgi:MFS family permease
MPFGQRIKKLFTDSPLITLLMTLCGFLYAIRTMFLLYSVNYLSLAHCGITLHPISMTDLQDDNNPDVQHCRQDPDTVAIVANASAWYTVAGCVGVYLSGVLKDKLPKRHRSTILVGNVIVLIASLSLMKFYPLNEIPFWLATVCVAFVGFSVFGAYKTSTGAFAVDIGGKHMKATCSALMGFSSNGAAAMIIVCKGFLGGNWDTVFTILIALGVCGLICASAIYNDDLKKIDVPGGELTQPLKNGA